MLVQGISARSRSSRAVGRSLIAAAVLVACALAPAAAGAADPPANIPLGSMPPACSQEGSTECQQWLLSRLNAARVSLGLSAYRLPADFLTLSADRQIFILTDLDRAAYGYTPISGLNVALDEAAAAGVRNGTDPRPPSAESPWNGFGSDWASTGPLLGYYLWMYDDGYPGPNLDCPSPGAGGCWGHRHVILGEGLGLPQPEVLGVATNQGGGGRSGTALIVSSHSGASTYYTWAQAQSEGAGSVTGGEETTEPPPTPPPAGGGEEPPLPWPSPAGGGEEPPLPWPSPSGGKEEPPPTPPPATCSRIGGTARMRLSALSGRVSNQLSTSLSGRQSMRISIAYPPTGVVRLRALTSASCTVTSSGREFRGVGSAKVDGVGGFTASFTFLVGPEKSTFSLQLTRGSKLRLRASGIPLRGSGEVIS